MSLAELGVIAAICDVCHYLSNAYECMVTRKLEFEHGVEKQ